MIFYIVYIVFQPRGRKKKEDKEKEKIDEEKEKPYACEGKYHVIVLSSRLVITIVNIQKYK